MARAHQPDARRRILDAAVTVFAEHSFEGARVDQVAKTAGVPKSLIYYHFKSKEEILEVLFGDFIGEYKELLRTAGGSGDGSQPQDLAGRLTGHYQAFAFRNKDLIRIMFIDSLKKSERSPVIFKIVEAMLEKEGRPEEEAPCNDDRQKRLVAEFFTGVVPLYAYLCFSDAWADHFGVEKGRLGELFLDVFGETHGTYHS
ncbi:MULTISPECIES: TetR/AcrR family transcriptional regulator [Paenibacillus]|uniref:TetR/AcrR family transcriptional regulator n=1 Tax=Paenibacillus TaxID=44249 RepID=UPI0022B8E013|nr:TetR/AcrR family transcriptional regulator [Paenibacillus caseinilyticus]MCZ8518627.1 TetR/AcrR family transcriptional regulator [Paenibacillus caseinilyticus]